MALSVETLNNKNKNPHHILSVPVLLADVVYTRRSVIVVPEGSYVGSVTIVREYLLQIQLQFATWRQSVYVFCAPICGLE